MLKKAEMGRVTAEFIVANNRDVVALTPGAKVLDRVQHVHVTGVVDSGAAKLVLPQRVVQPAGAALRRRNDGPHGR